MCIILSLSSLQPGRLQTEQFWLQVRGVFLLPSLGKRHLGMADEVNVSFSLGRGWTGRFRQVCGKCVVLCCLVLKCYKHPWSAYCRCLTESPLFFSCSANWVFFAFVLRMFWHKSLILYVMFTGFDVDPLASMSWLGFSRSMEAGSFWPKECQSLPRKYIHNQMENTCRY